VSIDLCSKCGAAVDTDDDTEFYGEDGEGFGKWPSLCENCREELDSEAENV
jgi:hypothetical protein